MVGIESFTTTASAKFPKQISLKMDSNERAIYTKVSDLSLSCNLCVTMFINSRAFLTFVLLYCHLNFNIYTGSPNHTCTLISTFMNDHY